MIEGSHRFEIARVAELRAQAARARSLPRDGTQRWMKSPVDPNLLARVFAPTLQLRDGWTLRAYRVSGGLGGGGLVYAMPHDAPFPEPDACMQTVGKADVPHPPHGVAAHEPAFADAIAIDGSPWSYLCMSLFVREARAFGEEWHAIVWGNRTIVGYDPSDPTATASVPEHARVGFELQPGEPREREFTNVTIDRVGSTGPEGRDGQQVTVPHPIEVPGVRWYLAVNARWPADFRPEVALVDGSSEVALYLHSGHLFHRIWREVDRYDPGTLRATTREQWIATGPQGFVY